MTRVRLAAASALLGACAAAAGCTSGTTADCSDAACLVVSEVSDAGEQDADGGMALVLADAAPGDAVVQADAH